MFLYRKLVGFARFCYFLIISLSFSLFFLTTLNLLGTLPNANEFFSLTPQNKTSLEPFDSFDPSFFDEERPSQFILEYAL